MKKIFILLILIFITQAKKNEFMDIKNIKQGMKGIGKTVFSGTKIENFEVEILGVLEKISPKQNLILAKLSGGPLEKTGVIAGMSGSPVYIDGKLIGAVAYAWSFAKEPVAGITPIYEMLSLFSSTEKTSLKSVKNLAFKNNENINLIPLAVPLMIGGCDVKTLDEMKTFFNQFNLIPVQSGGTFTKDFSEEDFIPGSAIGVQLVKGDMNVTAIGTLTYRDENKVLGFGHPMFHLGKIDMPMTSGYVHTIMPSQYNSFKLASSINILGAINVDGGTGIAGIIGNYPSLIPVEIKATSNNNNYSYHFEIIKNELFFPQFFMYTVMNTFLASEKLFGKSTVMISTKINLKNKSPLSFTNYYFSNIAPLEIALKSQELILILFGNEFEKVEIENIYVDISTVDDQKTAKINKIYISKDKLKPGESFKVTVFIKPYLKEILTSTIDITVPKEMKEENLEVKVLSANTFENWEKIRAFSEPQNFQQLANLLDQKPKNNEIIICLCSQEKGMVIKGNEFPALPTSVFSFISPVNTTGEVAWTKKIILVKKIISTDYIISGEKSLFVELQK